MAGSECYDREGRPISREEGSQLLGSYDRRLVGLDVVTSPDGTEYEVSTMHLVVDHSFGDPGGPVLFETGVRPAGGLWDIVRRYGTETEARVGHRIVVAHTRNGFYQDDMPTIYDPDLAAVRFRLYVGGVLVEERLIDLVTDDADTQRDAWLRTYDGHVSAAERDGLLWMLEVFDPDAPAGRQYMRLGTDPGGMRNPLSVRDEVPGGE